MIDGKLTIEGYIKLTNNLTAMIERQINAREIEDTEFETVVEVFVEDGNMRYKAGSCVSGVLFALHTSISIPDVLQSIKAAYVRAIEYDLRDVIYNSIDPALIEDHAVDKIAMQSAQGLNSCIPLNLPDDVMRLIAYLREQLNFLGRYL